MKRQEIRVCNFIQIGDQEEVLFESLPIEKQKEISRILSERVMLAAGYRKVTKEGTA